MVVDPKPGQIKSLPHDSGAIIVQNSSECAVSENSGIPVHPIVNRPKNQIRVS